MIQSRTNPMRNLTPLQARFVQEYLKDLNATAAARRAGYSSPDYGRKLTQLPVIQKAIQTEKDKRARVTSISTRYVVKELIGLYETTLQEQELNTAARCLELLGKHVGAFTADNAGRGNKVVFVQNLEYNPAVKDLPPGSEILEAITDQGQGEDT